MAAGPEGGQFTADVWTGQTADNSGLSAAPAPPRPQITPLEAKLTGGQLVATLPAAQAGAARWITRITVSTPGYSTASRAYVYVGDVRPENLVMGTRSGTLDVALENPPLFVPEGSIVSVQWDAGPTRAIARLEYTEA